MGRRPLTPEELAEAEERQRILIQAFPSARNDVLPTTMDDGPPVVRGVPPPMVGTREMNGSYKYNEGEETREQHAERVRDQYAAEVGADPAEGPSLQAPPGSLIDPRALVLQINPLEELARSREAPLPDHTDAGARMQDESGNFLGLQKQPQFSREAQAARARELYGNAAFEEAPRWEDEFLQNRQRRSDADIHRAWVLQSAFHGNDHGMKFREMLRNEQKGYDEGLQAARQSDLGNQRVSPALAEAIAGSGLASPESAVLLRMNDPLVKAFQSGGYSQGLRAEGQDKGLYKNMENNATKLEINDTNNKAGLTRTIISRILGAQSALANKGAVALDDSLPDATKLELALTEMQRTVPGMTEDQAMNALSGDFSGLSPEDARRARLALPEVKRFANDPVAARQRIVDQRKTEGGAESRRENKVADSIELAKNDLKYAQKWQDEWESAAGPMREAIRAWKGMSERGQKAFVQWGSEGLAGSIKRFITDPKDQALAGAVRAAIDAQIKHLGGSAVTGNEWVRIAEEIGITSGSWSPFQSTAAIEGYFDRAARALTNHRKMYESQLGGWKGLRPE